MKLATPSIAIGAALTSGAAAGGVAYLAIWSSVGLLGKAAIITGLMANPAVAVGLLAAAGTAALAGGVAAAVIAGAAKPRSSDRLDD